MPTPNELLVKGFQEHGYPDASIDGDWVLVPGRPPARATMYPSHPTPHVVNTQLDVEIALDDGRVMTDSMGALGKDEIESLLSGFSKFSGLSFHAMLCSVYGYQQTDQIDYYQWNLNGIIWDVYFGPVGAMQLDAEEIAQQPPVEEFVPENLFEMMEAEIKSQPLDQDTHWASFFYAQNNGQYAGSQVTWDNRPWQDCEEKIRSLNWPQKPGYASIRRLAILRRQGSEENKGSKENAREIERALATLLDYCSSNPLAEDEAIYVHLRNSGFSPRLTDRVIAFGPMSFASIILPDIYPTEYYLQKETPPLPLKRLDQEPVFNVGRRFVMTVAPPKEAFMNVAGRDAVLDAVNQALHEGAKLEDIRIGPTFVYLQYEYKTP